MSCRDMLELMKEKTPRNIILGTIDYILEFNESCDERYKEFLRIMRGLLEECSVDLEDYSSAKMKITFELKGFDIDETYKYLMKLKLYCVDARLGVIDYSRPVELSNVMVSILDF